METDNLIYFGDEIKALDDNGKVGGYLVRFGSPKDTDLTDDFFSKETDLGIDDGSRLPVYYNHGFDGKLRNRRIGRGTVKFDEVGAWFEAQLEERDEYEKHILELVKAGKLGWSSGAAGHLVEKETIGKSNHIVSWPIGEASMTTKPAEYRNNVLPIKSLITSTEAEVSDKTGEETEQPIEKETPTMDETEIKALIESAVAKAVEDTVKAFQPKPPDVKAGTASVQVIEDEADRALRLNPFKSAGEFYKAVALAGMQATTPEMDKRLLPLKSTGLNEAIPSQGGFLITQDVAAGLLDLTWGTGTVLGDFRPQPIGPNSNGMIYNIIDETNRTDGNRMGGVQAYWLEEGGEKTKSKPKFRQINTKLRKVAALVYATDELLADAVALEGWINRNVPTELRFKVEDAIIEGNGVGKPLGILNSGAFLSCTRTNASNVDAADILGMWSRRYVGVSDYVWYIHPDLAPELHQMTLGQMPIYLPPGGLTGNLYGTLLGRPVKEIEYCQTLGTLGDIMLVSPSQYILNDKGGIQSASSIHVNFTADETVFRFVYRVDGQPIWDTYVTPLHGSNTVSPFLGLAATT